LQKQFDDREQEEARLNKELAETKLKLENYLKDCQNKIANISLEKSINDSDSEQYENLDKDTRIVINPAAAFITAYVKLNFQSVNKVDNRPQRFEAHETEMLVDTGCMISTMSAKLYKKLNAVI